MFHPEWTSYYNVWEKIIPSNQWETCAHQGVCGFIRLPSSKKAACRAAAASRPGMVFAHRTTLTTHSQNHSQKKLISPRQQPLTPICTQLCPDASPLMPTWPDMLWDVNPVGVFLLLQCCSLPSHRWEHALGGRWREQRTGHQDCRADWSGVCGARRRSPGSSGVCKSNWWYSMTSFYSLLHLDTFTLNSLSLFHFLPKVTWDTSHKNMIKIDALYPEIWSKMLKKMPRLALWRKVWKNSWFCPFNQIRLKWVYSGLRPVVHPSVVKISSVVFLWNPADKPTIKQMDVDET